MGKHRKKKRTIRTQGPNVVFPSTTISSFLLPISLLLLSLIWGIKMNIMEIYSWTDINIDCLQCKHSLMSILRVPWARSTDIKLLTALIADNATYSNNSDLQEPSSISEIDDPSRNFPKAEEKNKPNGRRRLKNEEESIQMYEFLLVESAINDPSLRSIMYEVLLRKRIYVDRVQTIENLADSLYKKFYLDLEKDEISFRGKGEKQMYEEIGESEIGIDFATYNKGKRLDVFSVSNSINCDFLNDYIYLMTNINDVKVRSTEHYSEDDNHSMDLLRQIKLSSLGILLCGTYDNINSFKTIYDQLISGIFFLSSHKLDSHTNSSILLTNREELSDETLHNNSNDTANIELMKIDVRLLTSYDEQLILGRFFHEQNKRHEAIHIFNALITKLEKVFVSIEVSDDFERKAVSTCDEKSNHACEDNTKILDTNIDHYRKINRYLAEAHFYLGVIYQSFTEPQKSALHYYTALKYFPPYETASLNLAALHHKHGGLEMAEEYYRNTHDILLQKYPRHFEQFIIESPHFSSALSLKNDIGYRKLLEQLKGEYLHSPFVLNMLASQLENATANTQIKEMDCGFYVMFCNNYAQVLYQRGKIEESLLLNEHTITYLRFFALTMFPIEDRSNNGDERFPPQSPNQLHFNWKRFNEEVITILTLMIRSSRAVCDWSKWYLLLEDIFEAPNNPFLQELSVNSFLPFDSIGLPLSIPFKYKIALNHAKIIPTLYERVQLNTASSPLYAYNREELLSPFVSSTFIEKVLHPQSYNAIMKDEKSLNIGYLSHDFNDHPTAHLIYGVFNTSNVLPSLNKFVRAIAYSYGKNDKSYFRSIIEETADLFFDLAPMSDYDSVNTIVNTYASFSLDSNEGQDKDSNHYIKKLMAPHIMIDLQAHTLGTRNGILSSRVAPIQISYLIYPFTSGVEYIDYILADNIVLSPDVGIKYFTEKVAYIQGSYQINTYTFDNETHPFNHIPSYVALSFENDTHQSEVNSALNQERIQEEVKNAKNSSCLTKEPSFAANKSIWELKKYYRRLEGLPEDVFIYCNLNKNDKVEPSVFGVWMNILKEVPNSILWLLEASQSRTTNSMLQNFQKEAQYYGVDPERIYIASWSKKTYHINRHIAADVFLDTFYYGAHSTATDALFGGLPFLTMTGSSFSSRVGTSLLKNHYLEGYPNKLQDLQIENTFNDKMTNNLDESALKEDSDIIQSICISSSIKEYEETAILLGKDKRFFSKIQFLFWKLASNESRLFNTKLFTNNVNRLYLAIWENYILFDTVRLFHIIQ